MSTFIDYIRRIGRSLSMMSSSSMHVNPDIPEAHALRGWFDAAGAEQTFQAHTSTFTGGGGITFDRAEVRNLNEVKTAEFGMMDKPEYFCAQATIMHIKNDNISYPACPTQGCGKKVVELGDSWRCEKCDKSYPKPQHRYVVHTHVCCRIIHRSLGTWFRWPCRTTRARLG